MAIDLATMYGWIVRELAEDRGIRESMERLIAQCASQNPHPQWQRLEALPFEDTSAFRDWIERPFRFDPPPEPLAGLWFGLFNPVYEGTVVADLYVCGSNRFEPNLEDNDWAVGPDWWPEHRYANSSVLASVYKIAYERGGLGNDAEYPLCLAYAGLVVRDLLKSEVARVILESAGRVGVAVGFDSGDFVLLGRVVETGLLPFG
jgi:hypothetical protein